MTNTIVLRQKHARIIGVAGSGLRRIRANHGSPDECPYSTELRLQYARTLAVVGPKYRRIRLYLGADQASEDRPRGAY